MLAIRAKVTYTWPMSETTSHNIIDKIRKLLDFDHKNCSIGEVENAASMAQALMDKHKLTRADIKELKGATDIGEVEFTGMGMRRWKAKMIDAIANVNGCTTLHYGARKITLIGRPEDREMVQYLVIFICRQVQRLAEEDYRTRNRGEVLTTWITHYGIGASISITRRMRAEREANKETAAAVGALVLHDKAAAETWVAKRYPNVRMTKSKTPQSLATALGFEAGKSLNWKPAVRSGANLKQLGGE